MKYKGENRKAGDLTPGDFITLTGYSEDASEVEYIRPMGPSTVAVGTCDGCSKVMQVDKSIRLYA